LAAQLPPPHSQSQKLLQALMWPPVPGGSFLQLKVDVLGSGFGVPLLPSP
jgi:hypothetical protein